MEYCFHRSLVNNGKKYVIIKEIVMLFETELGYPNKNQRYRYLFESLKFQVNLICKMLFVSFFVDHCNWGKLPFGPDMRYLSMISFISASITLFF